MKRKIRKLSNEEVMTQARAIARGLIKAELKRQGVKLSYVEASQITKAAKHLIELEPKVIKIARRKIRLRDRKKSLMIEIRRSK